MNKPHLNASIVKVILSTGVLLFLMCSRQVFAFKDPLELPAMMAPKAAKALALNVTSQGSLVLTVGERGIVLIHDFSKPDVSSGVKDEQGLLWKQSSVPVSVNLTRVVFASDKVVFAVGHDGVILRSDDAGRSWKKMFDGNMANKQVVAAAKAKLDALQAQFDLLSKSTGQLVSKQATNPATSSEMQKLQLLEKELETAQFGFEDAQAGARFGAARPMLDVWFKDEKTGWVVGSYGQIFETRDSGTTWTLISSRLDNPDFRHYNGLYGDSSGVLLIAGEAGQVYRSDDFGMTWKRFDTGYTGHFYGTLIAEDAMGAQQVFAYGFGGNIYRSSAGFSKWEKLKSPTTESIVQALLIDNVVVFVDQKGRLIAADKGGDGLRYISRKEGKPVTGMVRVGNSNKLVLSAQGGPRTLEIQP